MPPTKYSLSDFDHRFGQLHSSSVELLPLVHQRVPQEDSDGRIEAWLTFETEQLNCVGHVRLSLGPGMARWSGAERRGPILVKR